MGWVWFELSLIMREQFPSTADMFFFLLSNCVFFKEFLNSSPANENAVITLHLIKAYTALPPLPYYDWFDELFTK